MDIYFDFNKTTPGDGTEQNPYSTAAEFLDKHQPRPNETLKFNIKGDEWPGDFVRMIGGPLLILPIMARCVVSH